MDDLTNALETQFFMSTFSDLHLHSFSNLGIDICNFSPILILSTSSIICSSHYSIKLDSLQPPCSGRWASNKNPVDPTSVLRGPCCGRLVIAALLQEALWGSAQGPHAHLTRSPRSDLYDTGDMCEFDVNEYI